MASASVSFEFFPPKTADGLQKLVAVADELKAVNPDYISVTFGAGGSTQDNTKKTVRAVREHTGLDLAPHISCVGTDKAQISQLLDEYKCQGIKRLVVLRGDLPSGYGSGGGDFNYAEDLVRFIREHSEDHFHICVAVYPECHPLSGCMQTDLSYFKQKVDAGANEAITQYFYSADAYECLLEETAKLGIDIPITPGIMPITNYTQLARFSDRCGAEIPRWITKRLIGFGDDVKSIRAFGLDVVSQLCEQLVGLGAKDLHFYTLNKAARSLAIIDRLNLEVKKKQNETV
ncbi:MAG: methylenetetrahydrofolate reductase [NAD(P)H] [Coxiellaceae bacterium]|nr:methylenetetrahydrofolate reductase [NAD(P)H] [Coxiellaceae bacterium]